MSHLKKDTAHLELVPAPAVGPLNDDEARLLFGAYFDGFLDEEDQKRMESALAKSPKLQSDFSDWQHTFDLLARARKEELLPPPDMRSRVLKALDEERRAENRTESAAKIDDSNDAAKVVALRQRRWPVLMAEVAIGIAAVCALVVGYQYGTRSQQGPKGVESAGFSQKGAPVAFDVSVKGISATDVIHAARSTKTALMNEPHRKVLVFEGQRSEVARFLMELRLKHTSALVEGVVPRVAAQDARYVVNLTLVGE